ncbi:MAG: hypothetical protein CYG60_16205 [Actinobacteria bacterium]|nr:MAG: hypothetical protein CYG60_16205 [Actinomycetota bacterium]
MHSPKFDWAKYLALAEQLAQRHGDEAAQRAAISRAYYAMYCSARNKLESWQLHDRNKTTKTPHADVWEVFEEDSRTTWILLGQLGNSLKGNRVTADYEDEIRDIERLTRGAIRQAKKLNSALRNLSYWG